jgi:hypothetical protein
MYTLSLYEKKKIFNRKFKTLTEEEKKQGELFVCIKCITTNDSNVETKRNFLSAFELDGAQQVTEEAFVKACKEGDIKSVQYMFSKLDGYMIHPFFGNHAASSGNKELVEWLLLNIVDEEDKTKTSRYCLDIEGLVNAASGNHLNVLDTFWKYKKTFSFTYQKDQVLPLNPVAVAASKGYLDVVKWFYEREDYGEYAYINMVYSNKEKSAMDMAILMRQFEVAKWLYHNPNWFHSQIKHATIDDCIERADSEILNLMLKIRLTVYNYAHSHAQYIARAAEYGRIDTLEYLENNSEYCSPNTKETFLKVFLKATTIPPPHEGLSIMDSAIKGGSVAACKWCKDHGYLITLVGDGVKIAADSGKTDVLKWISEEIPDFPLEEATKKEDFNWCRYKF